MRVIVIVRTRNEEKRIGKFCEAYREADKILVSDGGSWDRTKEIASIFPNVEFRDFSDRVKLENGRWRNNDASHANYLISEAQKLDPSWIIYDDCDCRPNVELKNNYRTILETTDKKFVMVARFYFWGEDEYFPKMSSPNGNVEPSLWAWRGSLDFKMIDLPPAYNFSLNGIEVKDLHSESTVENLLPPYALLHYSWDEERVKQKLTDYKRSGFISGYESPLVFAGHKILKESWMNE